jgi:predicted GNAT family acetyltransferase
MALELRRYAEVGEFYRRVEPFLVAHEAENNLPIRMCTTRIAQPERNEPDSYLAEVKLDGETVAVAVRTPPFNVALAIIPERQLHVLVMAQLVDGLRAFYKDTVPGVIGPTRESRAFAKRWQRETGQAYRPGPTDRIYQLDRVVPVTGVPGSLRRATTEDRELLIGWVGAFHTGAHLGPRTDPADWADQALSAPDRAAYLWEDGEPVAMVGQGKPTPHGALIGLVYTPPEKRGRGYASACTAAVSQLLLDNGWRFCFLYTNRANPTPNHIYQTIGYRPVCGVNVYEFDNMPGEMR